ncbi:uncharacterized protein LOC118197570 [Stegodyphus dumicola]|uniref:uncharacterized protein LOC118197570 n=1 Tax=Stegodyphus dumicola TaxID=202533 RepID=UPI0015AEECA1|nr:uncharacterized protein LOC118197570 [Stegodyphus dumicola]
MKLSSYHSVNNAAIILALVGFYKKKGSFFTFLYAVGFSDLHINRRGILWLPVEFALAGRPVVACFVKHELGHVALKQRSQKSSTNLNVNQHPHLVEYESEPKAYPRGSWRHSSSSSKDISPDNSSTDNELWLSVGEDIAAHKIFRTTPEHLDGRSSSRSSISPPSPPMLYSQHQKRVSEDSTGSGRPIFFASSRRGSKGSNQDSKSETSCYSQQQRHSINVIETHSTNRDEFSRKSSLTHSEESGFFRRDSKSGGSSSWRTDQESSSATTSRGEKSSASMEEVLESLLAIPPSSSRSSSPTSPRRSRGPGMHMPHRQSYPGMRTFPTSTSTQDESRFKESEENNQTVSTSRPARPKSAQCASDDQRGKEDVSQSGNDQGKTFDDRLKFPSFPSRSTSTTATQKPSLSSPLEEVNLGSFCRSSSTSPLEDDIQSPTSMEVLVPEGEEQELSSIIEEICCVLYFEDSKEAMIVAWK